MFVADLCIIQNETIMKVEIVTIVLAVIVLSAVISCQTRQVDTSESAAADSSVSALLIPVETGYADVNGLHMYYEVHGLPKSRLAILPGTTQVGMMQRTDWLIPMITDFLDLDLNQPPPAF